MGGRLKRKGSLGKCSPNLGEQKTSLSKLELENWRWCKGKWTEGLFKLACIELLNKKGIDEKRYRIINARWSNVSDELLVFYERGVRL